MMSSALRASLSESRSLLHVLLDLPLKWLRPAVAITAEDERKHAKAFDRSRGYELTRQERSKLAYELAEGAPVLARRRRLSHPER
jgi:hypothetical protein